MEKAGKKAYMGFNRTLLLVCVLAMVCMVGQRVCFGLQNEIPWPLFGSPTYWSGGGVDPTAWFDPCNWTAGSVPAGPNNIAIIGTFVTEPPYYAGDPCVIEIRSGQVAECNYLRLGNNESYVTLIIDNGGTLNIYGPGLRIPCWTEPLTPTYQLCQLIVNGGTLTVNGNTDQACMIVNSGDVNIVGEIGMGAGASTSEVWSNNYYLEIHNGNVRGGTLTMSHAIRSTIPLLTDINGTGQLILKGNVTSTIGGYMGNGWLTAYGGDPNYIISMTLDVNGDTVVAAVPFSAAKAKIKSPAIGATVPWEDPNNKGHGPTLTWYAGITAVSHNVYFGYTFSDVNSATPASPQYKGNQALANTSYTVNLTDINLGQTYYWRIDEVNGPNTWKGDVWLFSIPSYRTVDDFESYANDSALAAVWKANTNAYVSIDKTTVQGGLQSMNMTYNNTGSPYFSEANMVCSALPACPNDWTAANVKLLAISLHGGQALDSNANPTYVEPNVYVIVQSNGGAQSGVVYYPDVNDFRQASGEYFRFWAIPLSKFSAQGVNLQNVTGLVIGIGDYPGPTPGGGQGSEFWVDTIQLQPPTCLQQSGDPDLNNDCVVDIGDLTILADNWLDSNAVVTASAPASGPVLWYKFNDGQLYGVGDTAIHDFSGNNYTGTLTTGTNLAPGEPTGPAWGVGTGYDGNGCLNLANGHYVNVPLTPFSTTWGAACTFSFWFNDPVQDDNDSMFFQVTKGDGTNRGPQVWMGSTGFMQWACGYDPNTTYRSFLEWGQNSNYSNPLAKVGRWVHYAFVKSPGDMRIYQDGVMVAEDTVTGNTLDALTSDGNSFFTIGAWQYNGTNTDGSYVNGLMEDFRVYNYALTPAQVLSLAVAGGTATSPMTQQLITPADIGHYEIVNFNDFALLADKWHQQPLFPSY